MNYRTGIKLIVLLAGITLMFAGCDLTSADEPEKNPFKVLETLPAHFEASAVPKNMAEIPGEGVIVTGEAVTPGEVSSPYIARYSQEGEVEWEIYNDDEWGQSVSGLIRTDEGHFVTTGKAEGAVSVIKFNADGDIIWRRTHLEDEADTLSTVGETGYGIAAVNGGYLISGRTGDSISPFLLRVDQNGQRKWFSQFPEELGRGNAPAVLASDDGRVFSTIGLPSSYMLAEVSLEGRLVDRVDRVDDVEYSNIVRAESEGFFGLANGFSSYQILVTHLSGLNVDWETSLGMGRGRGLSSITDGGTVAVGRLNLEEGDRQYEAFLTRLNEQGEVLWEITGNALNGRTELYDVTELQSGDMIAVGARHHDTAPRVSGVMLHVSASGQIQ